MTTWDLHADAAKISDQSPAIKTFAQHVADILQPVPPPVVVQPLWDGTIPNDEWEFVGVHIGAPTSPPISARVTTAPVVDGIRPPNGATTITKITTQPGDQYLHTTGWRTLGRQFDPAKRTNGPGYESAYVFAWLVPVGYPGDAHMFAAPMEMHQTAGAGVQVTGPAPFNMTVESSAEGVALRVSGGTDANSIDYVNTRVLQGYKQGVMQVTVIDYKNDPATAGRFGFYHATKGFGPLEPIIQKDGIGTMYSGTRAYPLFGGYRAQIGLSTTAIYLAGLREYGHFADALAYANGLAK